MCTIVWNPWRIVSDIWQHRYLLGQLIKRDVLLRYRGAMFGVAWTFLSPLFMLAIFAFFGPILLAHWPQPNDTLPIWGWAVARADKQPLFPAQSRGDCQFTSIRSSFRKKCSERSTFFRELRLSNQAILRPGSTTFSQRIHCTANRFVRDPSRQNHRNHRPQRLGSA